MARLLLVDDDPLILATFKHGLRNGGYDVTAAASGEAALACAASALFDLAVLDIRMPGVSGIELGRLLRQQHNLASIYLTAIGSNDVVAQAVQDGALTYLVKPIEVTQLIPAIEAALVRIREICALAEQKAQLDRALTGDRHISVAIGMLMALDALTEQQAFEILRSEARRQRRKLEDYCSEFITRPKSRAAQPPKRPPPQ